MMVSMPELAQRERRRARSSSRTRCPGRCGSDRRRGSSPCVRGAARTRSSPQVEYRYGVSAANSAAQVSTRAYTGAHARPRGAACASSSAVVPARPRDRASEKPSVLARDSRAGDSGSPRAIALERVLLVDRSRSSGATNHGSIAGRLAHFARRCSRRAARRAMYQSRSPSGVANHRRAAPRAARRARRGSAGRLRGAAGCRAPRRRRRAASGSRAYAT